MGDRGQSQPFRALVEVVFLRDCATIGAPRGVGLPNLCCGGLGRAVGGKYQSWPRREQAEGIQRLHTQDEGYWPGSRRARVKTVARDCLPIEWEHPAKALLARRSRISAAAVGLPMGHCCPARPRAAPTWPLRFPQEKASNLQARPRSDSPRTAGWLCRIAMGTLPSRY